MLPCTQTPETTRTCGIGIHPVGTSSLDGTLVQVLAERIEAGHRVRLGVFGGTFDPIHNGHLYAAEQARIHAHLDLVLFIPAGVSVFKRGQQLAPGADRLALCEQATSDNPFFAVSDIELLREGDSYTVDTLRTLREQAPQEVELVFVVGADALESIESWRESAAIAALAHIVCVSRPGSCVSLQLREHLAQLGFRIEYVEVDGLSVSSHRIREKIARGESVRYLVPPSVYDYLCMKRLYAGA